MPKPKHESLLVNLGEIGLPILNTKVHESAMDEIERLAVCPFLINIINQELDVSRYTRDCELCNFPTCFVSHVQGGLNGR